MPLKKGCTKANVSQNIREMRHAGHPQDVSVAAGIRAAGCPKPQKRTGRKKT